MTDDDIIALYRRVGREACLLRPGLSVDVLDGGGFIQVTLARNGFRMERRVRKCGAGAVVAPEAGVRADYRRWMADLG